MDPADGQTARGRRGVKNTPLDHERTAGRRAMACGVGWCGSCSPRGSCRRHRRRPNCGDRNVISRLSSSVSWPSRRARAARHLLLQVVGIPGMPPPGRHALLARERGEQPLLVAVLLRRSIICWTTVRHGEIKFYGAFVLNHRVVLHANAPDTLVVSTQVTTCCASINACRDLEQGRQCRPQLNRRPRLPPSPPSSSKPAATPAAA